MTGGRISLNEEQTDYAPQETVSGYAIWEYATTPKAVDLHLLWFAQSPHGIESRVVGSRRFEQAGPKGREPFSFELPKAPWSYYGDLFSINWALELVVSGQDPVRLIIICGPHRRPVALTLDADSREHEPALSAH